MNKDLTDKEVYSYHTNADGSEYSSPTEKDIKDLTPEENKVLDLGKTTSRKIYTDENGGFTGFTGGK